MTRREQLLSWGAVAIALLIFLMTFSSILSPFIFGATIAYFCDPIADWFQKKGLSRLGATVLVLFIAIIFIVLMVLTVLPILVEQTNKLIENTPGYLQRLRDYIDTLIGRFDRDAIVASEAGDGGQTSGEQLREAARNVSITLLQQLWDGGVAFVSAVAVFVVTPVVAFYLLLDWDRMIAKVDAMIPRRHLAEVRSIARDIDDVLAGFMRGQLLVCMIQGTFYSIALSLIGLEFGLFVGIVSGFASFIPYVGSLLGLTLSMGLALSQFWGEWYFVVGVLIIFLVGQVVEGNFLTPYLVGGSVGLHPVWLIFALSAFGSLFGFAGLLLAVPAAAAIGVLTRWGLERYKQSPLYTEEGE